MEQGMIIIQMGFGLSIKRGHMFGDKESQRKMISIKLPLLSIYVLNKKATEYWYEVGRYAFNDPNWFIENHHAVRQAKLKAMVRKHQAWCAAHDEVRADYQKRLDELQQRSADQGRVIREQSRDIEAYRKLVGATDGRKSMC
jgi:hypothetical protein